MGRYVGQPPYSSLGSAVTDVASNPKHSVPYGINVSVEIERKGNTAWVHVHAPLYLRTHWTMLHQYSARFTDSEILRDRTFQTILINAYG